MDVLTVDGNGHGLSQDVAVSALEGRDLAQLVELLVVIADTLGWLGVDNLEVETIGLCDSEDGGGARVALKNLLSETCCEWDEWQWIAGGGG